MLNLWEWPEYRSASARESLRAEKECRVVCRRMRVRAWAASERWLRLKRGRGRMGMSGRLSAGAGTVIRKAASETCLRAGLSAGWSGCDGWPARG